ncbi:unnamed protein product, partial [Vitis vinifera]|uniref:Uncharacterized protein n=1 Tax=Vitis vinifera TaxID=29760 RepID=D7SNX5_VITVI
MQSASGYESYLAIIEHKLQITYSINNPTHEWNQSQNNARHQTNKIRNTYQNLNSRRRRMKGLNSSKPFVGNKASFEVSSYWVRTK